MVLISNYRHGARFEYRVKDYLEACGYEVARSAGSHSPSDLFAFRHNDLPQTDFMMMLVQCKNSLHWTKSDALKLVYMAERIKWWVQTSNGLIEQPRPVLALKNEKRELVFFLVEINAKNEPFLTQIYPAS